MAGWCPRSPLLWGYVPSYGPPAASAVGSAQAPAKHAEIPSSVHTTILSLGHHQHPPWAGSQWHRGTHGCFQLAPPHHAHCRGVLPEGSDPSTLLPGSRQETFLWTGSVTEASKGQLCP